MDYMKMWMREKQKLREIVCDGGTTDLGDRQLNAWDASAVLWLLDQIEMEEYFGEEDK